MTSNNLPSIKLMIVLCPFSYFCDNLNFTFARSISTSLALFGLMMVHVQ